jgi:HTH-type transcriptional regulator/antitoxin HigA
MEEMRATARVNPRRYARLLATILPAPIETEEENERAIAVIGKLMDKGQDNLTPEESNLLGLLAVLVQDFEDRYYPMETPAPREMLLFFMEQNNLRQKDLVHVFGSRSTVSAVVNGKRGITKAQARRLAERFHTSADLFI